MQSNLSQIKPGQSAVVKRVGGSAQLAQKLAAMGVTKGAEVSIIKLAPLGDPIEVGVRGYSLSLRKDEAENIEVF